MYSYNYPDQALVPPEDNRRFCCRCKYCNEDILEGDEIFKFQGDVYHEECFADNSVNILINLGAESDVADYVDFDEVTDLLIDDMKAGCLYA